MTAVMREIPAADLDGPAVSSDGIESHLRRIPDGTPRVVIVGAGFGGLAAAKALANARVQITLIDRRNYHLFQPLLYQVATAGLSPADIATPIRGILRNQRNATVLLGRVTGVDATARDVLIGERRVPYDYLIIATGARHAYFGHDEWESFAPGLKKIEDATDIRRRVLLAFEMAENATNPEERRRLLNFVVIGAGPTGVELAGTIAELAHRALASDFRNINPREARIMLIEAGPRVLPSFPEKLSAIAKISLERLNVEVHLGTPVTTCDAEGIELGGERIYSQCVIWAAGVMASPAARWLDADKDRAGRVKVGPDLSVPTHPEIYVIGDTAGVVDKTGKPVPGIAPAAKQMGQYVADLIRARIVGKDGLRPFRYRHLGSMATIGRKAAVADFGRIRISGRFAWLLWGIVHIYFLIGFRNRIAVLLDWLWAYVTFHRGSRLITGPTP
jgi:NADH:ubiquinone reductase (H+-translocating)